jgi:hypothetical protein
MAEALDSCLVYELAVTMENYLVYLSVDEMVSHEVESRAV